MVESDHDALPSDASISDASASDAGLDLEESPVLVPHVRPRASSSMLTESEPEAITEGSLTPSERKDLEGISELDTIHDGSSSTQAGHLDYTDIPEIPSSVSQLAIPHLDDDADESAVLQGAPSVHDSEVSFSPGADSHVLGYVNIPQMSYAESTTSFDTQDMTFAMPKMGAHHPYDDTTETGSIEPLDEDTVRYTSDNAPTPQVGSPPPQVIRVATPPLDGPSNALAMDLIPALKTFPAVVVSDADGQSAQQR